jgi:transposase
MHDLNRQREYNLIGFLKGKLCGWSGQARRERLSSDDQFVGQMDCPSTSLHSIRSQRNISFELAFLRGEAIRKGTPVTNSPYTMRRFHMNYIGIDVAKEELVVYDGKNEYVCKNTRGLPELEKCLTVLFPSFDDMVIIFEATGPYSHFLREFCAHAGIRAWIVNPLKSASFTKALGNRSKTDAIDAKMLYELHKVIQPEYIIIPKIDETAQTLSMYISSYELIIKTRTALSNHLHALAHTPNAPEELKGLVNEQLQGLKKAETTLLDTMEQYVKNDRDIAKDYENLLSIKGIGRISALSLLMFFRTYKDTSRSEITALAGLDPTRIESGISVRGRRKISKGGNGTVRKILYFPVLNCIQHNRKIRIFYERLIMNHKVKKLAVIAAMRKLLLIAHAVYKSKIPYQDA